MMLIPEGLATSKALSAACLRRTVLRGSLSPVQAAQVLRMLDDGHLKEAAGDGDPGGLRTLLRDLQERYPEALSAFNARLPGA
ncbi:hypothetical protein [Mesoterricola silvestris]|uniref:Uncharacterized protein n=1 Tax=Mesoterricola silvestris TaxID=2927979 RepID=A0AA48GGQ8_9BACT|nr:hypothetical protein [Mesoterricola silvestris]BDU72506.1 hypothetical protein METEAL_16800 [Mesoterricola silvestris]